MLFLFSCQTDDLYEEGGNVENEYTNLSSQTIPFEEIENAYQLKEQLNIQVNNTGKNTSFDYLAGTNFIIDIEEATVIQHEGEEKSYTFILKDPENPSRFLNLVTNPEGDVMMIFEYDFTEKERESFNQGNNIPLTDKVNLLGFKAENTNQGNLTYTTNEGDIPCFRFVHVHGLVLESGEEVVLSYVEETTGCEESSGGGSSGDSGDSGNGDGDNGGGWNWGGDDGSIPGDGDLSGLPGGGGGSGSGGGSSGSVEEMPTTPKDKPDFYYDLPVELKEFWSFPSNEDLKNNIFNYLIRNNFSEESIELAIWQVEVLKNESDGEVELYDNWFGSEVPPNDSGDVFNINDYSQVDPETYSSLPSLNDFYAAFPKNPDTGGEMLAKNACTIRVSRGLNYSDQPIPVFYDDNGNQKTQKGGDNKNYVLNVSAMLAYMKKAYPNVEPIHLKNKTQEEYLNAIKGKWGIYIMLPKSGTGFTASGHADLFQDVILDMLKKFISGNSQTKKP